MQGGGANSSVELATAPHAAPLDAAWESIRSGLRRDRGAVARQTGEQPRADGERGEARAGRPAVHSIGGGGPVTAPPATPRPAASSQPGR